MPHDRITDQAETGGGVRWGLSPAQLLLVGGFVFIAAGAGLAFALQLQRMQQRALHAEVTRLTDERMRLLRSSTLRCLEVLHAMVSFLEVSPELTRERFRHFVRGPLARLPELQAFEWIPRVARAERDAYEAAARRDGLHNFGFTELAAAGGVTAAQERATYHPVFFVEPAHSNLAALGFDVGSDPERRLALQRAMDAGAPVATAPVRLAQEREVREFGMLVFAPVADGVGRHAVPRGFAVAVLRIRDFVRPALQQLEHDGFAVRVFDRERPGQVLFALGEPADAAPAAAFAREASLEVAGRDLRLSFVPTQRFLRQHASYGPWLFASAGLVLSLLVAAHIARSMRYTREVERRALERAAANQRLQAEIGIRKQAQEEAAAARQAQAQFLANLSHEIRTPLNAIIGYSQILQRSDTEPLLRVQALQTIAHSGQQLLSLLDEVIDLTKIEAGHIQLRACDFDLASLVTSVAFMLRPNCEQKGLELKLAVDSDLCWVRGDEGKLRQVLINLLGNAVKFTEQGEIRVVAVREGACVHFEVSDTGMGIDAAQQERVFATFYQTDASRAQGGAGLGLSISRRLVELLGGELLLRSAPGRGSTFYFSLELAACLVPQREQSQVRLQAGAACSALVVDDRESNRDILQHMLVAIGCSVCSASSGPTALELAAQQHFDVIFLDLLMPGLDGIETASALHKRGTRAKLIAFSASVLAEQRAHYRSLGFDGFLSKPFGLQHLHACLRDAVGLTVSDAPEHAGAELTSPPLVPTQLLTLLRDAAQLHQVTRLRRVLSELETRGERERIWSQRLRSHALRYEMAEVLALVTQLEAATENAA
jgi:signal transduction histidine kinase/DNA-binding response OmpR family regulator